jgi:hypothetical protein
MIGINNQNNAGRRTYEYRHMNHRERENYFGKSA